MAFARARSICLFFTLSAVVFIGGPARAAISLDDAFQAALKKNETVLSADQNVIQAEEHVSQAKGGILPTISLNGTHQIQDRPEDPVAREFFPENSSTVSIGLSQPLFRGFREFAALRRQQGLLRSEQFAGTQARLALYQDVASTFLNVLTLERDLKNMSAQVELYEQRSNDLRSRSRTGESSMTELLTAQASQAALLAEIELVKGQLEQARDQFHFQTGLEKATELVEPDTSKDIQLKPVGDYLGAIESRPDIQSAKELLEASREDLSIAKGAHWPTADVTGNYYFLRRPDSISSDIKWDVLFRVSLPIFEGGVTQSRVREASSKSLQAELQYERAKRTAQLEVETSYANVKTRLAQIKALEKSVELSERNTQVLQREFRRGLTRSIDVQLALAEFRNSRRLLDQARFGARLELIRLQVASASFPQQLLEVHQ